MRAAKSILAVVVLVLSTMPALALLPGWQKESAPASPPARQAATPPSAQPNGGGYQFHPQGPGPHRGEWLRKYGSLPPSEQEQQLKQDPGFRNLPPERQNQLLDRLHNFNNQPPEKKQQILNRMETFEHMTPEQQSAARNLYQQYRGLPDAQRSKVSQAYRRLRGMPPEARNQVLNSEEFRNNYSDQERDLLRSMTDLNLAPTH